MMTSNLSLYNTKSITYIHPETGKQTSLDLTITNPTLFLDWTWKPQCFTSMSVITFQ